MEIAVSLRLLSGGKMPINRYNNSNEPPPQEQPTWPIVIRRVFLFDKLKYNDDPKSDDLTPYLHLPRQQAMIVTLFRNV